MPQASNLTVKKADGTTDVTFSVIAASAGDKTPAIFRQENASPFVGARPTFKIESQANAAKTARVSTSRLTLPYAVTDVGGRAQVVNQVIVETRVILPNDVPDTLHTEAVAMNANLMKHSVVSGSLSSGFSPT